MFSEELKLPNGNSIQIKELFRMMICFESSCCSEEEESESILDLTSVPKFSTQIPPINTNLEFETVVVVPSKFEYVKLNSTSSVSAAAAAAASSEWPI
ncbi:hypothetical protein WICPIJ_001874 [Wickerhamomyces pijperi]|uniref:Uncharacterized protein n=1 Tax=Wickerhamomyces pijperi TaxID=599730 RepID=A0A9P8QCY8_WICPI|nr:hypothetical protein WICPIJ_001874 [Wickerhamomyces pijperi]